jgi:hypothetical protein
MADPGGFLGGDEPGAVAVSREGKHVYVVNGGLNFFEAVPPSDLDLSKYNLLILGPAMGALGLPGGIGGVIAATAAFMNTANRLYTELLLDIKQQAESGLTFVSAPGVTGVFDGPGSPTPFTESWLFTSDVGFGWSPVADNGGLIVNQFRFRNVFAKRPFDITVRPDGRRALVPFFQTGNFGVLDLDAQAGFMNPPGGVAKPAFAVLPKTQFQGFVGVTPAIRFDNHVWPSRGAFRSGDAIIPSIDESRLFPWHAQYAQNGRFAVATHVGNGAPRTLTAVIPDFVSNIDQRNALLGLGGTFNGTTMTIVEAGQTITVAPGDHVQLTRGGGAVSVIDDESISYDLTTHAAESLPAENNTVRPYFATAAVCNDHEPDGRCTASAQLTYIGYRPASGTPTRFHRPRGVDIEPFVTFQAPRFGDHVGKQTALQIVWRDARIRELFIAVRDPALLDAAGNPTLIHEVGGALSQQQIDTMTRSVVFSDLFLVTNAANGMQLGKRYVVEARARLTVPATEEVSRTSIELVLDDLNGPVQTQTDSLSLRPFLVPVLTVPTSQPKQLTATFTPVAGQPTDVTASSQTTYLWLGDPAGQLIKSSNSQVNLLMRLASVDVTAIIAKIKSKLSSAGVPIDFKLADITVDGSGRLTMTGAGLQVVQAVFNNGGDDLVFSAPIVVIGGLELSDIDLEPDSLLTDVASATGAEKLGKKLADKLGKKVNTPLVLTATSPGSGFSFLSNQGAVELEDVEFTYLGAGKISISSLLEAVEPLVRRQVTKALGGPLTVTGQLGGLLATKAIMLLIDEALTDATLRFVDLTTADAAVATVNNSLLYKGDVTAVGPGIGAIKGQLKLGDFGSAEDAVPVWVLPTLTQAIVDPTNTLICRADSPNPGPRIHTLAVLKLANAASITPASLGFGGDVNKLAKALLPAFLPTGTFHDVTFTLGDFKFGFRGTINVDGSKITWADAEIQFYVPNVPGVTNTYAFFPPGNPQLPGIVHAGTVELFGTHVVHEQIAGKNQINNFVAIPALGSVQGIGSVTVTDFCSTPFVMKEFGSSSAVVAPGDQLTYVITVGNPRSTPVDDVKIEDTALYQAAQQTGNASDDAVEVKQVIPIGTIPARSTVRVPIVIPAFGFAPGTIANRATATGSVNITPVKPCQVDPTAPGCVPPPPPPPPPPTPTPRTYCEDHPSELMCKCAQTPKPAECIVQPEPVAIAPAAPFITEMVLDPKRDWSDTTGGNGVPFDSQPGTAAPDAGDIWIEVTSLTAATNWRIRLTDTTGATFTKTVGPPLFGSAVTIVSGFGAGTARIVKVEVIDQVGLIRQSVDVAAIEAALGPATGPADEALTWSIFGSPTPVLQQFLRRTPSIGVFNPF